MHDHNVRRLQLKRRKVLLLHVLEQKLFEEVRIPSLHSSPTHFLLLEMREEYRCHRSTSCLTEKTSRTNQRTRIQTTDKSSQVHSSIFTHSSHSILFHRMRNEFTSKQHQTELINFNEYSARRQKELGKRHAFTQKQFPKNIKVNLIISFLLHHSRRSFR